MAPSTHPNPIPPLVATILISLSAVPCLYYAPMLFPDSDTTELSNGATVLPFVAFATMAFAIGGLAAVAIKPYKNESDSSWYLYMFSFMGFTSVVDLVLSLGALGLVDLGTFYLRSEERHHSSSHGAFLCFWDGIFQFSCHLSFVYGLVVEGGAFWQHKGYRAVVWWWLASIFNSMGFMPSAAIGLFGLYLAPSFALNIPWLLFPLSVLFKLLDTRPKPSDITPLPTPNAKPSLLMIAFLGAVFPVVTIARWIVSSGSYFAWAKWYLKNVEPELGTAARFPLVQLIVYMMWVTPAFIGVARALWVYRRRNVRATEPIPIWVRDTLAACFGCLAQGQWCYLGSAYMETEFVKVEGFRPVPKEYEYTFWVVNLGLFVALPAVCFSWIMRQECVGDRQVVATEKRQVKEDTKPSVAAPVPVPHTNGHSKEALDPEFAEAYLKASKGFLGYFPWLQAFLNEAPRGPYPNRLYEDALKGKRVLVTGAAKGIGRELALLYALHGARVCVASRDVAGLQKVTRECLALRSAARGIRLKNGGTDIWSSVKDEDATMLVKYDALVEGASEALVAEVVQRWGGLDVLVLNHTLAPYYRLLSAPLSKVLTDMRNVTQVNYWAYVELALRFLPHLQESAAARREDARKSGRDVEAMEVHAQIVGCSSMSSKIAAAKVQPYAASKAAINQYFSHLRLELEYHPKYRQLVSLTTALLGASATETVLRGPGVANPAMLLRAGLTAPRDMAFFLLRSGCHGWRETELPYNLRAAGIMDACGGWARTLIEWSVVFAFGGVEGSFAPTKEEREAGKD